MTILFVAFTVLFLLGFFGVPEKLSLRNEDFMSHNTTSFVNGYFISLVFLSHLRNYVPEGGYGPFDQGFIWVINNLGQLIVTTFLFYSGYGVAESIKSKPGYISSFPKRRILSFLLDVWLAVGVYLVLMIATGTIPPLQRVLLSMVGWLNLGNSNWYIFAILWMYVSTYIGFRIFKNNGLNLCGIAFVTLSAIAYAELMKHEGVGGWYYSTILCYPAGMLFSYKLDRIRWLYYGSPYKHCVYAVSLVVLCAVFKMLHPIRFQRAVIFNLLSIVFVLLIILVCMKMPAVGRPYAWIGRNLFCFYIYQRVPMIILKPLAEKSVLLFSIASLVGALILCSIMVEVHKRYKSIIANG